MGVITCENAAACQTVVGELEATTEGLIVATIYVVVLLVVSGVIVDRGLDWWRARRV